jgi:hypothetical protein
MAVGQPRIAVSTGFGHVSVARHMTGAATVLALAGLAMLVQALDLVTFLRVVTLYGLAMEVNPLARALFAHGGPAGLAAVKLMVAVVVPAVLACRAQVGPRPALARWALVATVAIGTFGFLSNLVTLYA